MLDEISDISSSLQAKLLRVLEERQLKPLGDTATRSLDVRVIAATNKDLERSVAEGLFRADLYYRLNVVPVRTPPLRDIPEDIPLIAFYFLSLFCRGLKLEQKRFRDDTIRLLATHQWKGNARELQNAIKRAVIFSKGEFLTPDDFEISTPPVPDREEESETYGYDYKKERKKVMASFNVAYITGLLRRVEGNVTLAATMAGWRDNRSSISCEDTASCPPRSKKNCESLWPLCGQQKVGLRDQQERKATPSTFRRDPAGIRLMSLRFPGSGEDRDYAGTAFLNRPDPSSSAGRAAFQSLLLKGRSSLRRLP